MAGTMGYLLSSLFSWTIVPTMAIVCMLKQKLLLVLLLLCVYMYWLYCMCMYICMCDVKCTIRGVHVSAYTGVHFQAYT